MCFSPVVETGSKDSDNSMFLYLKLFTLSGIHITSLAARATNPFTDSAR